MKTKPPRLPASSELASLTRAALRIAGLCGAVLVLALAPSSSFSQQAEFDSLSVKTAQALIKAHAHSVVVADFVGPGCPFTQLGRQWADDFSAALVKNSPNVPVLTREKFKEFAVSAELRPGSLGNASEVCAMASRMGVDAVVAGHMDFVDKEIRLEVELYTAGVKCQKESEGSMNSATDDNTKELASTFVSYVPHVASDEAAFQDVPLAGLKGYGMPDCIYCPVPQFSKEAVSAKQEGTVVLEVIIMPDGTAGRVWVLCDMPFGLTEQAINAVKTWKFKPALGPDGRPAPARAEIEVMFRLLK